MLADAVLLVYYWIVYGMVWYGDIVEENSYVFSVIRIQQGRVRAVKLCSSKILDFLAVVPANAG